MENEMTSYHTPFGRVLRKLMGSAAQQDFADQIGVPVQTLNNWLTGKVGVPQEKNLQGLATLSGFSVAKLKGLIASSDASEADLDRAFETPISDPGEAIAKRLGVYQTELTALLSRLDPESPRDKATVNAVRNLLSSMQQTENLIESHAS